MLRYTKAAKARVYTLRELGEAGTELWVAVEERGKVTSSRKLVTFDNPEDVAPFLEDVERQLREGGWQRI